VLWSFGACLCAQDGERALMHAADKGHTSTMQLLLDAGADKDAVDDVRDQESRGNRTILTIEAV